MRVAVIGVGAIAKVLLPAIIESECVVDGIASRSGDSAPRSAPVWNPPRVRAQVPLAATDLSLVFPDPPTAVMRVASLRQNVRRRPPATLPRVRRESHSLGTPTA